MVGAEGSQRRDPERHLSYKVMHDLCVGKRIDRDRVAVAAAFRQREGLWLRRGDRLRLVLRGKERTGAAWAHRMGIAPHLELPFRDPPLGINRCLESRHHGWAKRFPGMLLLTHPLKTYRVSRQGAGNQRGIGGGIVGAIVTVASRAFDVNEANPFGRHAQQLSDGLAVGIDALRVGPNGHRTMIELSDRT